MKRLTALVLVLGLTLALAGCGAVPGETTAPIPPQRETTVTVPETTTPVTTTPDTEPPETTVPETVAPETTTPETTIPETEAPTEPEDTQPEGTTYILNTNTKKFHYPGCSSADDIKESNKQTYVGTRQELIAKGYSPCGRCDP